MLRLIGRRLLLMIPTLILASMLIFALAEVLPGDVGRSILGPYATEEQVQLLNEKLGADRPLVVRYVAWAGGFVTGDWGESALLEVPVRPLVLERSGTHSSSPASHSSSSFPYRPRSASSPVSEETASWTARSRSPPCR